jgi:hypothetical protein
MLPANYPFTLDEVRRLAVYKAAVEVGFYTDWPPTEDEIVQLRRCCAVESNTISHSAASQPVSTSFRIWSAHCGLSAGDTDPSTQK